MHRIFSPAGLINISLLIAATLIAFGWLNYLNLDAKPITNTWLSPAEKLVISTIALILACLFYSFLSFDTSDAADEASSPMRLTIGQRLRNRMIWVFERVPNPLANFVSAMAYSLRPHRLGSLLPIAIGYVADTIKPNPASAPKAGSKSSGFGGMIGEPGIAQILAAYRRGFFPFAHLGPPKWMYSGHHTVLFFDEAKCEKHTRRFMRNSKFDVSINRSFTEVMEACAAPRAGKFVLTWITPGIRNLFQKLHDAGHAHSVEVWDKNGTLVGGLFGVAIGKIFFTESQFHIVSGTSKVAFAVLNRHLAHWGYAMNDGKDWSQYLDAHGFRILHSDDYQKILDQYANEPAPRKHWEIDEAIEWNNWQGEFDCHYSGEKLAPFDKTSGQLLQSGSEMKW